MSRLEDALARIDAAHAEDPERDAAGQPKELAYARRMSAWLERLAPQASEPLRLAVRCQHLRRWAIPRNRYPEGKSGYLRWRRDQALAHAALAAELLAQAGYGPDVTQRVQALVRKERARQDPEAQLVEDTTCLAFLELDFEAFARKHDAAKLVDILRKTWVKMSPQGQEAARALDLPPALRALMQQALASP